MGLTPAVVDWSGAAPDRAEGGAFRKGDKALCNAIADMGAGPSPLAGDIDHYCSMRHSLAAPRYRVAVLVPQGAIETDVPMLTINHRILKG